MQLIYFSEKERRLRSRNPLGTLAGVAFPCISQGFPLSSHRRVDGHEIFHLKAHKTYKDKGFFGRSVTPGSSFAHYTRYAAYGDALSTSKNQLILFVLANGDHVSTVPIGISAGVPSPAFLLTTRVRSSTFSTSKYTFIL